MANVRIYTSMELTALIQAGKRSEVETIVKRQAERYNKQITRALKKGASVSNVGGSTRLRTRNFGKLTNAELVKQYTDALKRFGAGERRNVNGVVVERHGTGGATKKGLQSRENELLSDIARIFNIKPSEQPERWDTFLSNYYNSLDDAQKQRVAHWINVIKSDLSGAIDKLWYNDATAVVLHDRDIESMAYVNLEDTKVDYATRQLPTYLFNLSRRVKARIRKK